MLYYSDTLDLLDTVETRDRVVETLARTADSYRRHPRSAHQAALETHADLVGAAVVLGQLHQAICDHLNPAFDDARPAVDRVAAAATLVGRHVARSVWLLREGDVRRGANAALSQAEGLHRASVAVSEAISSSLPRQLEARVPEGYAFYTLYPEMYLASLERALQGRGKEGRYTVVGIRSIGTSLATLVAGALLEMGLPARVETLRPRGHPFNRYIALAPALRERFEKDAKGGGRFIIVDEGPGLTCSSFLSVCSALVESGAQEEDLILISAWRGAPSIYASEEARARWRRLTVFCTDARDAFDSWRALTPFILQELRRNTVPGGGVPTASPQLVCDISHGVWREHLYRAVSEWPVVHRPSERTKLLLAFPATPSARRGLKSAATDPDLPAGDGQGEGSHHSSPTTHRSSGGEDTGNLTLLAKFAGLGDYGRQKLERARVLAEAGFSPDVVGLAYGFLLYRFVEDGRPMAASNLSPALLARMVDYYAFLAQRFSRPPASRFDSLAQLVQVNAGALPGVDAASFVDAWRPWAASIDARPLVLLDGRPQPHEWLRVGGPDGAAFVKTDSADHFRDHTLVGEQNILWDLAGACEEWEMNADARGRLMDLWEESSGDRQARRLLDFYRAAYLAFRLAALHYAVHSTDDGDIRADLQHAEWQYRQRLRTLLDAPRPAAVEPSDGREPPIRRQQVAV